MKVICINEIWFSLKDGDPAPKIGDECTVVGFKEAYFSLYYELMEFPGDILYIHDHFVKIEDETELVNQWEVECL